MIKSNASIYTWRLPNVSCSKNGGMKMEKCNIKVLNIVAFFVHACSVITLIVVLAINDNWNRSLLHMVNPVVTGRPGNITHINSELSIPFPPILLSIFFFLGSACAHLFYLVFENTYKTFIFNNYNPVRWIEYGITSSLMIMILLMLSNVVGLYVNMACFGCNLAMILFGDASDRFRIQEKPLKRRSTRITPLLEQEEFDTISHPSNKISKWLMFIYGSLVGMVPWIILFTGFGQNVAVTPGTPPLLYTIPIILFFNYALFALNHFYLLKYDDGLKKSKAFRRAEAIYHILSISAKVSLGYQTMAILWM